MKKERFTNIILLLMLLLGACSTPHYTKTDNGIIVTPKNQQAKAIRLEVVNDDIIHVQASPTGKFSEEKSLIVVSDLKKSTNFKVEEIGSEVILTTTKVTAKVSIETGAITYLDEQGKILLQEIASGGKSFAPIQVEELSTYEIKQVFESPADEAFYGLGAHQNGQMNYKGDDVELVQHNIVDVVPFLYSSKNYGLLWDNYSITKFGDPRSYQSLNTLQLFDREGNEGGLTATYFVNDKIKTTAVESNIEYEFLETPTYENFPKDVSRYGKVIWEGTFTSNESGTHKFQTYSSGYLKIWIDGELILDKWRQNWNPWTNKFTVDIESGVKRSIKMEWIPCDAGYFSIRHLDPYSEVEQQRLTLSSEVGDNINYYFIKGNNADEVIKGYRTVTGKAPIMPKWSLGFWQSRERYKTQDEILGVVDEYRKRKIPLDNIVLDWQFWEDPKWGSHEFDLARFPDPKGMIDQLHRNNVQIMITAWPKFNKGTANYEEMDKNGFLFKNNIEKGRLDWVGIGYENTFYDPFNEKAGEMFWKQLDRELNSKGIDAWWLDATEPDMHSNLSIEARKENMTPTAMGPGAKYFNAFSLMNAKGVYEGQRKSSPEKRVFILTRSAFAGQQRYGAATWSGDIVSRWSDFKDQIAAGINFGLSGLPYWTMDIGGFSVERRYENQKGEDIKEWKELNTRWFQYGAFCPIFRSHGQYPYREIYNIAEEGSEEYNSMVYYTKLRYTLLPYTYSFAGSSYFDDNTIMRGLVMDFSNDDRVKNIADQYMFGNAILVNPVFEYKSRSRSLYLPASAGWYNFYTGEFNEGGKYIDVKAPLGEIPLYVKAGSIIPTGPEIQYSSEKIDPITLYVFEGSDATFTLYEDEGVNYNYEQGKYSNIVLTYEDNTKTLTIGDRKGEYAGMPTMRTFQIVWVNKDHPVGISISATPHQVIEYSGEKQSIKKP